MASSLTLQANVQDATLQLSGDQRERMAKPCNKCARWLPMTEFYRHPKHPDGLAYKCKECSKRLNMENYRAKRGEIRRKTRYAYNVDHRGVRTKMLAYQKVYRKVNKDKVLDYARQYRETGRSFICKKGSNYRKTPRGRFSQNQKHYKRKALIVGSYTHEEWLALVEKYGRCLCCKTLAAECELTADHVVPLVKGGLNTIDNIQPLCRSCNSRKRAQIIDYRT